MKIYSRSIAIFLFIIFLLTNVSFSQTSNKVNFNKSWLFHNKKITSAGSINDLGPSKTCDLKILQRPGLVMNSENIYLLKDIVLNKMYGDTLQIVEDAKYAYYNIKEIGEVSFKSGNYSLWGMIGGTLIGAGVGLAVASAISDSKTAPTYISLAGATLAGGITGFFIGKQIPKYKIYNFSELDPDTKKDAMLRVIKENQR